MQGNEAILSAAARADWRVRGIGGEIDCGNCGKTGIPAANFDMHSAMCLRQYFRCESCQHVMPAGEKQTHFDAVLSVDSAFAAAAEGGMEVLKTFLDHGGDHDAINHLSDRLLHVAVRSGKVEVTKLLLDHKADTAATNAMLDNPLQIAMKKNEKVLLLMLMKHNKRLKKERAKNISRGPAVAGWGAPLRDVTNTATSCAGNSKSGSAGPAGGQKLSGTVKMCGPGEDICGNCGEVVPTANLGLHELRCQRHAFRCPHCSEMVPASERDAHLDTSTSAIFAAANTGDVVRLEYLLQHGADIGAARENGNSMLHVAVARKDVPLVIWLVEEIKINPSDKNALNDTAIDLALRARNEEMLLFLTLALSETDTGSETTAAIQAQLPGGGGAGLLGQPKQSEQERVIERMFQMDEVRCLQNNNNNNNRAQPRGLPSRFQQLAHMSPIIVRARSMGPLDLTGNSTDSDQSHDQSSCHDTARLEQECRYADDASAWQMLEFDGEGADGQEDGVEMAGFTVKGNALQVPANHAGRQWQCNSPQVLQRAPSPSMSPITVGCLPEFMPSPLDLDDDAGRVFAREKSPLEVIRRDITAAGSNLGAQLAKCVAQFDGEEVDWAYDSEDLEKADFTIEEGDEDDGCDQSPVLSQCGKGLMTMGFEVPLGGDGDDGDSCLDVFFGYVRRGIANEVLRAVRRWALDGSERDGEGNTAVHIAAIHGNNTILELLVKEGFDCSSRNREGQTPADCAQIMGHATLAERVKELGWERYKDMPVFNAYTAPAPNEDADDGRSARRQCRDAHLAAESAAAKVHQQLEGSAAAAPTARPSTRGRPSYLPTGDSKAVGGGAGVRGRNCDDAHVQVRGARGGRAAGVMADPSRAHLAVKPQVLNQTPPRTHGAGTGFRGRRAGIIADGASAAAGKDRGANGPPPGGGPPRGRPGRGGAGAGRA